MKLSEKQKESLIDAGYPKEALARIEAIATSKTLTLSYCVRVSGAACKSCKKCFHERKRISQKRAKELLGEDLFLSGLGQAALTWSACRLVKNGSGMVFFYAKNQTGGKNGKK